MKKLFFVALTLVMGSFSSQANVSTTIPAEKPEWVIVINSDGKRIMFDNGCYRRISTVNLVTGEITDNGQPC